jgi:hypothetical protein
MVLDGGDLANSGGLSVARGRSGVLEHADEGWWRFEVPGRGWARCRSLSPAVDLGGGAVTAEARTWSWGGATGGLATNVALGAFSGRRQFGAVCGWSTRRPRRWTA